MAGEGSRQPQREPIYRAIRLVAVLDVVIGLAIVFLGEPILGTADYRYVGLGLAAIGAIVFAFFTRLASLAGRR